MLRFASARLLVPSLSLLCLLALAPASHTQNAPKPTPAVQKLADQAKAAQQAGKNEEALRLYNEALAQARQSKDVAGEASTLTTLGNVSMGMGQPQKALEFYEQALPLYRQPGDKSGEARLLGNMSHVYYALGQPQKALAFLQQVQQIFRQIDDKNGEAKTLTNMGVVYKAIGQPQKALEFSQQALPLYRQLGDKLNEATTLFNIGVVYAAIGQPQKALEFYEQALPLHRQTGDKNREAATLDSIGLVYHATGQPQKALEFSQQALPLYRQLGDKSGEAATLSNIGLVYADIGQPQKGLEFYEQALLLCRQTGDKNREAITLTDVGSVYANIGQPQKALEFYEKALPLYRQTGDKSGEAATLTDVGSVYLATGQPQKALEFFNQVLPLHRQAGNKSFEAATLGNIGLVYDNIRHPQKALEFYEQALLLHRQTGDKSGEAATLTYIGNVYTVTGQLQKALEFLNQALPLHRQTGNKQIEANTLTDIGFVYQRLGQPKQALEFFNQALPLNRQVGDKQSEANSLYYLARVEQKLQHPRQALTRAQQAVALLEELRGNVGSQGDARSTFLASHLYIYYQYLDLLRQSGHVAEAFALTQKTKARSLLDLLASSRIDLNAALTMEEKQQLQTLQQQAEQLNAQILKEGVENEVGAKKRFAALQTQLKQTENQLQTLADRLYALHPGLAEQQQAHTVTVADLASLLPSDTALLEYAQTSDRELLLFVVTTKAGKPQAHLYPIAVGDAQLRKQCSAFHDACADPRKDPSALSASLSRLLLAPAQKELQGKTRLIICPDGPLWNVAFAALRVPNRQTVNQQERACLWQHYELSYAYSATGMQAAANARRRHKSAEHATVMALANPFFGNSSRFGDLDGVPGQRPFERPSRPFELPSRPLELPSRPLELPSRPLELPSRPLELPSRPLELPSRPLELPSRQLEAAIERGKAIKSLPGAQQEAEAIHKLFPDAAIYTGKAAQESVVMAEAGKYKYLHFATHGFFNDAAPFLSCIVLAPPEHAQNKTNKAQGAGENKAVATANMVTKPEYAQVESNVEDGLLTARKVFGLHLNADLVTLSACNSGRGQVRAGDGIVGLTWAFFAAGCPSQVVSQWSVDDAATGQLMADFYKGLKAGKSKSAALRDAALKLSKDGKHSHPYYWTPFFLVGDWK